MVVPVRGEIWWADLGEPRGAGGGRRRPVLIVQNDLFNRSNLATVLVLSLTSNQKYAAMPGNVFLPREQTGLAKDSVVNVTQLIVINKMWLDDLIIRLPDHLLKKVDEGLGLVLGLA